MTAALLDAAPKLGATPARLFTPPLPQHVSAIHEYGIAPEHTYGYHAINFVEKVLGWELLSWQKWLYVRALEKDATGTKFRFEVLVILIARQNGKTLWLKGLTLWRLYQAPKGIRRGLEPPPAKLALIAMQGLDYAEKLLEEVTQDIKDAKSKSLRKEFIRHWTANGKHRLAFTGRRSWRATTASRKGGRSFAVDLADLDELREHQKWDAYSAIAPTTISRPNGMVVCTSNAGDQSSVVLRSLRDSSRKRITTGTTLHTKIGFFEWSVPDEVDPKNPKYWYLANPAMGYPQTGLSLESLMGALEAMEFTNMGGFRTEHLCQWVDALDPGIIPAEHWLETMDPESKRASRNTPVYAAVDVNYQRSKAYIAIASRRADGHLHVEVVAAARGTDWVIQWFLDRPGKFMTVAIQRTGAPASNMIKPLTEAGVPVVEWGGPDLPQGFASFYDKIVRHTIRHRPAGSLDRAAAAAVAKGMGDAWVIDRRHSPVDAAPLVACAAAAWAEEQGPMDVEQPDIHAWPDEDEIAQWQREANGGL